MLTQTPNTLRPFFGVLLITTLLTTPNYLKYWNRSRGRPVRGTQPRAKSRQGFSFVKGRSHQPEEAVTVLVTLGGPRSGRLNAFLNPKRRSPTPRDEETWVVSR